MGGLASRGRENPAARRYALLVGLAFAAIIVAAIVNATRTEQSGILGAGDDEGRPLPHFAVPTALGPLEGDANIAQTACESSERPCPEEDRRTPACEVDVEDAIRVCDLFDRPLAISFWFMRGAECTDAQDAVDRVARRYRGRVNFLIVDVRDDREQVREVIRERGWRVPVGYDADGAVSNVYGIGVCPTVHLAYPGGTLMRSLFGSEVDEATLERSIEQLLRASRERQERGA
jgi:hypothetical protein